MMQAYLSWPEEGRIRAFGGLGFRASGLNFHIKAWGFSRFRDSMEVLSSPQRPPLTAREQQLPSAPR